MSIRLNWMFTKLKFITIVHSEAQRIRLETRLRTDIGLMKQKLYTLTIIVKQTYMAFSSIVEKRKKSAVNYYPFPRYYLPLLSQIKTILISTCEINFSIPL